MPLARFAPVLGITLAAALAAAPAHAEPYPEQLTKDQIEAAAKAVQDALPKVDQVASKKCVAMPQDTVAEQVAAAACLRSAGAIGAAIMFWKHAIQTGTAEAGSADAVKAAARAIGPAYEAAGMYDPAATAYNDYGRRYTAEADAPDQLIRAICTWRQLGAATDAARGFKFLRSMRRKVKRDEVTLCRAVQPIAVPAATTTP